MFKASDVGATITSWTDVSTGSEPDLATVMLLIFIFLDFFIFDMYHCIRLLRQLGPFLWELTLPNTLSSYIQEESIMIQTVPGMHCLRTTSCLIENI